MQCYAAWCWAPVDRVRRSWLSIPAMPPWCSRGSRCTKSTVRVAMARTSVADSATSQFFINVLDKPHLDRANAKDRVGYAVFGQVLEGMDVVDRIRDVPTRNDVPVEDVIIKSIRRVEAK